MKKSRKHIWGTWLLQIIPVMIGVYLGFVVFNWSENSKLKNQATLFKQNLTTEIKTNQQRIQQNYEYHIMLRDSTRYYLEHEEIMQNKPDFFKGIAIETLSDGAFETGLQTGIINELTINQIQQLNELYTKQRSFNEFRNILLTGLIQLDFDENEKAMKRILQYLAITMTDVVIMEQQLINTYHNTLKTVQ